jgi:hypothetical protein
MEKNVPKSCAVIYAKNYCDLKEMEELKHILSQMIIYLVKNKKRNFKNNNEQ